MSSVLLYLAIVAVWAGVLVPMWLRRDGDVSGFSRLLHRRPLPNEPLAEDQGEDGSLSLPHSPSSESHESPDSSHGSHESQEPYSAPEAFDEAESSDEEPTVVRKRPRRGYTRAAVIARRRRRTSAFVLLVLTMTGVVIPGLVPWWTVLPPIALLAAHLCLLRVAAGIDQSRRREAALARLEARAAARAAEIAAREAELAREAEEASRAEVIDIMARNRAEVFDQYTDQLRAVGD